MKKGLSGDLDNVQVMRDRFFRDMERDFPFIEVGKTPHEVIDEDSPMNFKLLQFLEEKHEKLLIVPHIINRPYILDLNDDVSVIRKFCKSGFSVYMADWGYPAKEHRKISFTDYILYVDRAVDLISTEEPVSILGYCTGGIISLMYASLHPEKVEKLILLATPVDFSRWFDPRILWGKIFDVRSIVSLFGNVPGEVIVLIGRNLFMTYLPFYFMNRKFNKEFIAYESWRDALRMNRWFIDSPMIPASAYVQFIEDCYQKNLLIRNKMKIGSKAIDLKNISSPVLNILAEFDHIVPLSAGRALSEVYSGKSYKEIVFPSTHTGLSVSREAHLNLWPRVCDWLWEK